MFRQVCDAARGLTLLLTMHKRIVAKVDIVTMQKRIVAKGRYQLQQMSTALSDNIQLAVALLGFRPFVLIISL